jgi:hypothetical protein
MSDRVSLCLRDGSQSYDIGSWRFFGSVLVQSLDL